MKGRWSATTHWQGCGRTVVARLPDPCDFGSSDRGQCRRQLIREVEETPAGRCCAVAALAAARSACAWWSLRSRLTGWIGKESPASVTTAIGTAAERQVDAGDIMTRGCIRRSPCTAMAVIVAAGMREQASRRSRRTGSCIASLTILRHGRLSFRLAATGRPYAVMAGG